MTQRVHLQQADKAGISQYRPGLNGLLEKSGQRRRYEAGETVLGFRDTGGFFRIIISGKIGRKGNAIGPVVISLRRRDIAQIAGLGAETNIRS